MKKAKILAQSFLILGLASMLMAPAMGIPLTGINNPNLIANHPNLPGVKCTPDVKQLQDAVNTGGTIVLSGTFDLGSYTNFKPNSSEVSGTVFITNDVIITGDGTAKIKGGYRSFSVGLPARRCVFLQDPDETESDFTNAVKVKAKFNNLSFEKPMHSAIYVVASKGLEISNCRFFDAHAMTWHDWFDVPIGRAIQVGPTCWNGKVLSNEVTGDIMIKNNIIDGNGKIYSQPNDDAVPMGDGNYWGGMNAGILFVGVAKFCSFESNNCNPDSYSVLGNIAPIATSNIIISGNKISNYGNTGMQILSVDGNVSIVNNTFDTGPNTFVGFGFYVFAAGLLGEGATTNPKINISYNTVIQQEQANCYLEGIYLDSANGAVISNNNITANTVFAGLGIGSCSGCLINQNTIKGKATAAIYLEYYDSGNTCTANNVAQFTPVPGLFSSAPDPVNPAAHYILDFDENTSNNTIVGYIGNVVNGDGTVVSHSLIDNGANNTITGLYKYSNIGQAVKTAMKQKIAARRTLKYRL